MKLYLEFDHIVDDPMCNIVVNDQQLYSGAVQPIYDFELDVVDGDISLCIEHWDKRPEDTVVENGKIVCDRSFELKQIKVDNYDLEELIWQSEFRAADGAVYKSCLFFGPNGCFVLNFTKPVLGWILKTRHTLNNNDPTWEQDYHYYIQACKILTQISIK